MKGKSSNFNEFMKAGVTRGRKNNFVKFYRTQMLCIKMSSLNNLVMCYMSKTLLGIGIATLFKLTHDVILFQL